MNSFSFIVVFIVLSIFCYRFYRKTLIARREKLIDNFNFPPGIAKKLIEKYPHLEKTQADKIVAGMREYFHLCNTANHKMISMPSQAVDEAWHEFILFTREYKRFCAKALGRFLHHTPAEAMKSQTAAQKGIQRTWKISCTREGIAPRAPARLPLLFSLDAELDIPNGFNYSLNCKGSTSVGNKNGSVSYCASHIGCGSRCSGSGCSGDTGCGGGCGGD